MTQKIGYLFKKSKKNKEYKKRFYIISDGNLSSENTEKSNLQLKKKVISSLNLVNLRENVEGDYPYSFEIICPHKPKPLTFLTDSQKNQIEWCSTMKNNIENMLALSSSNNVTGKIELGESKKGTPFEENYTKDTRERIISKIFKTNICADCNNNEACWISLNLAVILCLECSGIHRKLGPNISKVRSLKLDNLNDEIIQIFYECGTSTINQIWEANIINFVHLKPNPQSKTAIKEKWIKKKYIDKDFLSRKKGNLN